ncbi:polysaccharide biosynthesis protein [Catenovulum sp. SM1970]|uniref:PssD/Cps14F family polysaccharide biosynthesis glycosyltransferase n=1 Tax=Marinifaba aquimaris TaxID=2741323 RepID=UPI0015728129|nr:PssD/Cps14F family polysaccharide biosynthesis glycosyltransferase [Marinifaba aquimaris]NTS76892.1 polysaccharide biosynthesis protein [Marinifaba aquimaris]
MSSKKNIVLLIAGEGGHFEQMSRLTSTLKFSDNIDDIYLITDNIKKELNLEGVKTLELGELRGKDGFSIKNAFRYLTKNTIILSKLIFKNNTKIISTGPGIAIYPSLLCRLSKGKVLHIETWSRFYSKSMTGKLMYLISNRFYIQNKELAEIYPKGIYSGRL